MRRKSQAQGTVQERLRAKPVNSWRSKVHGTNNRLPSKNEELVVEKLLLDAIDQVEALQRHNKNLFEELRKWKHRAEQLQMELDAKTIGEVAS